MEVNGLFCRPLFSAFVIVPDVRSAVEGRNVARRAFCGDNARYSRLFFGLRRIFVKVSRFADDVRIYIVKLYVLRQIFRADGRCVYLPDGVLIAEVATEIVIGRRARSRAAYVGYIFVGIALVHVFSVVRFHRDSATAFARAADGYEIRTQHIFHVVYLAVNAYIRDSLFNAAYA